MRKAKYILSLLLVGAFALLALGFYQIFKPGHQTAQKEINKAEISQKLKALSMPFIEKRESLSIAYQRWKIKRQ